MKINQKVQNKSWKREDKDECRKLTSENENKMRK